MPNPPSAPSPDYPRLAREVMDAWQARMAILMQDPHFIEVLLLGLGLPGARSKAASAPMPPPAAFHAATEIDDDAAAFPPRFDAASHPFLAALAGLERRVSALEARLPPDSRP